MDLRVTSQSTLDNALAALGKQTTQLGKLQEQASTGKKLLLPSDSPLDVSTLLGSKAQDSRLDMYLGTIHSAQSTLNLSVSTLQDAGSILADAKNIGLEAAQSTNTPQALDALAQQVEQLLGRLLDGANTKQNGVYLFGGAADRSAPFTVTSKNSDGQPLTIAYNGADSRGSALVGPGRSVNTLYSGSEIFQKDQRGATTYDGDTGAAGGSGTDSATGSGALLVCHSLTTYASGSGVQAGSSSAALDTVIGPNGSHVLSVVDSSGTGAAGTVALDGGPPVPFTNSDTNLKVTGADGAAVYIDASAITAGFNGPVAVKADGTISTDGGSTGIPITFDANQSVTNSVDGTVTNVNTTGVRSTGQERLSYSGTYDAFQVLISLRDDLLNRQGVPESKQLANIGTRLAEIDRIHGSVLNVIGEQSATLAHLTSLESNVQDVQLSAKKTISDLEDVDVSQVVVQLQSLQNLMQLTLASTSRLMSQTLLDYMH